MITYNKERAAWDFKEANEDEKEALLELAEAIWAQSMAVALARKWMEAEEQGQEAPHPKESAEIVFPDFGNKH